jgi:hypothetical protein
MADNGGLFLANKGTVGKGNLKLDLQIKGNLKDWMKLARIMTNSYADANGDADMFLTAYKRTTSTSCSLVFGLILI